MPTRARAAARYALGLPGFLRARPSPESCRRLISEQHARRAEALRSIFERGIYARPQSPYLALLRHAGIELGDIGAMLAADGVEATLTRLHESGVRLSIDEFKGRTPIRRPGLELAPSTADFDNPLLQRHYEARTSGARSGSRIAIDLDLLAHESAYVSLYLDGFGLRGRPFAAWRPVPPGLAGLKGMLRRARLGLPIDAWFSQYPTTGRASGLEFRLTTAATVTVAGACGAAIPRPRHVPLERAGEISRWLADRVAEGSPALLDTNWSSAVRVCASGKREGHELSGTFFRVGGEPATEARRVAVEAAGAEFAANYSMGEVGTIGNACPNRESIDEVHVATEKVAIVQPTLAGDAGPQPLVLTTLLPSCPKLMINVEVGDYAKLGERDCGCPFGDVGLRTTARSIGSHEKLTTEGMNFVGSEIAWLLEEALPARVGGGVGDFQLLEDRSGELSRISVVIDPAVATPPDAEVVATVLDLVAGLGDGQRLMAEQWRQAGALGVLRRSPYVRGGKLNHLHVIEAAAQR